MVKKHGSEPIQSNLKELEVFGNRVVAYVFHVIEISHCSYNAHTSHLEMDHPIMLLVLLIQTYYCDYLCSDAYVTFLLFFSSKDGIFTC